MVGVAVVYHAGMEEVSYSKARKSLAAVMDRVCADHVPIVITRKSDPAVVMLSLEDYNALEETAYLMRSPANARRLLNSIWALESVQRVTGSIGAE